MLNYSDKIFDTLYHNFESTKGFRLISTTLAVFFALFLVLIQSNRLGWLPAPVSEHISLNYFFAIELVFKLLLAIEVIGMIFILSHSVSEAIAKQFEILSLILLRQTFKEFSKFEIPINLESSFKPVTYMLSDAFGALFIFFGILIFLKIQQHRSITKTETEQRRFISVKKLLAVAMIFTLISIAFYDLIVFLTRGEEFDFFSVFYSILIFVDILIVIISLRYSHSYPVVFRNSGYAVATVFIRLALSAPHYYDAMLGVVSVSFIILLSLVYNRFELKNFATFNKHDAKK